MLSHRSPLFCYLSCFLNAWFPNSLCMISIATHLPASSAGCRRQQDTWELRTLIIIQRERYSMALLVQTNNRKEVLRSSLSLKFMWAQVKYMMCYVLVLPAFHPQVLFLSTSFQGRKIAHFPNSDKRSKGLLRTRSEGSHAAFCFFALCLLMQT